MATALFCEKKERVSLLPTYPFRTDLKYRCFANIRVRWLRPMSMQQWMGKYKMTPNFTTMIVVVV